jgi:hypothetical protein
VSGLQLLDQQFDVGGDEFLRGVGLLAANGGDVAYGFYAVHGVCLLCLCFSCRARHVPTCRTPPGEGGAAKRKGRGLPTRSEAEGERSEGLHKRSAEDWRKPLVLRQGRALSEGLVSLFVRVGAQNL